MLGVLLATTPLPILGNKSSSEPVMTMKGQGDFFSVLSCFYCAPKQMDLTILKP